MTMPPLPEPRVHDCNPLDAPTAFTADQMHAYAIAYAAQRVAPLVEALHYLSAYAASDNQGHLYEGDCPDQSQPDSRDPTCPACEAMDKHRAALAAEQEHSK